MTFIQTILISILVLVLPSVTHYMLGVVDPRRTTNQLHVGKQFIEFKRNKTL